MPLETKKERATFTNRVKEPR